MTKKLWISLSLVLAAVLFVGGFVLIGHNTKTSDPRGVVPVAAVQTVNFVGTWNQTSGMAGVTMTATITNGKISVDMESKTISASYWQGSFNTTSVSDANSVQVTSTSDGDPQLAKAGSKVFNYQNGDLTFEFSMLGQTATVHLQRSSE